MSTYAKSLQQRQPDPTGLTQGLPTLEQEHLWYRMASHAWRTLALVPADNDVDLLPLAENLAHVAANQPGTRVLLVNASLQKCRPPRVHPLPATLPIDGLKEPLNNSLGQSELLDFSKLHLDDAERALACAPQLLDYLAASGATYSAGIFIVDSPLQQTRGIPLLRSLDAALLCIAMGRTTFTAARRLVDLVGRHRVVGSIALT